MSFEDKENLSDLKTFTNAVYFNDDVHFYGNVFGLGEAGIQGLQGLQGTQGLSNQGLQGTSGTSGSGGPVIDDTTTDETRYPLLVAVTSGTPTESNVSSTKLTFNPSSGTLSATVFTSLSDRTQKTNIAPIEDAVDKINKINGYTFSWIDTQNQSMGIIAQELKEVLPELVSDTNPKTVNYNGLTALLIEGMKKQQEKITSLEEKIEYILKKLSETS
jgi:hypothetical protein